MEAMKAPLFLSCAALFFLSGCASHSKDPCTFTIDQKKWGLVPTGSNPHITPIMSDASSWYMNADGNYLICYNSVEDYVCGGIYETFDKDRSGGYVRDHIVCTS